MPRSLPAVLLICAAMTGLPTASFASWAMNASGTATYYSDRFIGRLTAGNERFSQEALTAAHNSLPFGTRVKVTNLNNSRSVVVIINDRMHRANSNLIDLTRRGARELGFLRDGRTRVRLDVLK